MDILLNRILSLIPKKEDGKYVHGAKKSFCERIGAPTNIISEWETGKTKSYRNYVHAVAMAYNVSVEWLRGETDEKSPAPFGAELNVDRIQSMVSDMSTEDLAALLSMAANEMAKRSGK